MIRKFNLYHDLERNPTFPYHYKNTKYPDTTKFLEFKIENNKLYVNSVYLAYNTDDGVRPVKEWMEIPEIIESKK